MSFRVTTPEKDDLDVLQSALNEELSPQLKPTKNLMETNLAKSDSQGIVTVKTSDSQREQEDVNLMALRELPRFEPLITTTVQQSSFFSNPTRQDIIPYNLDPEPVERMMGRIQTYIKGNSDKIVAEQLQLTDGLKNLDEHTLRLQNTIHARASTARSQSDALLMMQNLKQHSKKTRLLINDIVKTLSRLEPIIPSEERIISQGTLQYPRLYEILVEADLVPGVDKDKPR